MKDILPILERMANIGVITKEQLKSAQDQSRISGISIDKALIKDNVISEEDLVRAIADELGVPYMDLKDYLIDTDTVTLIPEKLAREKNLIPLFKIGNILTIAMYDPQDIIAIDEVRFKTGMDVEVVLSTDTSIKYAIEQFYGVTGTMEEVLDAMDKQKITKISEDIDATALEELAQEAPVVKFVNLLIMEAVKNRASDVHVEPEEERLRVRFRIDGVLHEISSPSKHIQAAIVSRIKILSKLDIAEKRRPQDGQLQMRMENRNIDVRVSTFPTLYGENVVLRILDKGSIILELAQLGFTKDMLLIFKELISRPHGIFLVTGPTGSGKTTTLYAAIQALNSEEKNIITLEDPVEYHLPMIRQSQINVKAGLTFANGLRSILRQDPDVIMVGEIRDRETADISVQAALTGHLVFSTLHTNNASGTISRFLDMGVEPFLISSSLIGILAQRLVRVVCSKCKEQYTPIEKLEGLDKNVFYRGAGCKACNDTGYYGRIGIFELMIIDDKIKKLIVTKASSEEIEKAARENGMRTLREDGLLKIKNGITTQEEVLRVTSEQ